MTRYSQPLCFFIVPIISFTRRTVKQFPYIAVEKRNGGKLIFLHVLKSHFTGVPLVVLCVQAMKPERLFDRRMFRACRNLNDLPLSELLRSDRGVIRNILSTAVVCLRLAARALLFRHVLFPIRKAPPLYHGFPVMSMAALKVLCGGLSSPYSGRDDALVRPNLHPKREQKRPETQKKTPYIAVIETKTTIYGVYGASGRT